MQSSTVPPVNEAFRKVWLKSPSNCKLNSGKTHSKRALHSICRSRPTESQQ